MSYWAITIKTDKLGVELVSDAFFSLGALGVQVKDSQSLQEAMEAGLIWDYIDDGLRDTIDIDLVTLIGFFQPKDIKVLQAELKGLLTEYGLADNIVEEVKRIDNTAWYTNWKSFYKPISVGKYIIVPAWQESDDSSKINIKIDPGMAFGTGEHQSTQLALSLMSNLSFENNSVYDLGCGSGILGIAAALCGAKQVRLIDIDEIAIDAAKINANLNSIEGLQFLCAGLPNGLTTQADIIVANLTADLLISFVKNLQQSLKTGGKLIVSGIIKDRWEQVLQVYLTEGFNLICQEQADDWIAGLFEV